MHNDLATFQMVQQLKTCWKDPDSQKKKDSCQSVHISPLVLYWSIGSIHRTGKKNTPEFYSDLSSVIGLHSLLLFMASLCCTLNRVHSKWWELEISSSGCRLTSISSHPSPSWRSIWQLIKRWTFAIPTLKLTASLWQTKWRFCD